MNASGKYRWLAAVLLFGIVYLVVGVAFPNPSASNKLQFIWRLSAWVIAAMVFGIHIGVEQLAFRSSPLRTALHVSASVSLGAFALAVAANIHALRAGAGNQRLLALALVIWPIITGVPAFIVALVAAAVVARLRSDR